MHPLYLDTVEKISAWAQGENCVHAAIVLGSQTRRELPGDEWSDLDVLLLVDAPPAFLREDAWLSFLGEVACGIVEETPLDWLGMTWAVKRVLFAGNRAVDFSIMPFERIDDVLALNAEIHVHGYRVIYGDDPQSLAAKIEASLAGVRPEPPALPGEADMDRLVQELLYHLVWAARKIRRGELWTAVNAVNQLVSTRLLQLIEFHAASVGAAASPIRYEGRFLEQRIPPWLKAGLARCFATYDPLEAAAAISHLLDVVERLADEIYAANQFSPQTRQFTAVRVLFPPIDDLK